MLRCIFCLLSQRYQCRTLLLCDRAALHFTPGQHQDCVPKVGAFTDQSSVSSEACTSTQSPAVQAEMQRLARAVG